MADAPDFKKYSHLAVQSALGLVPQRTLATVTAEGVAFPLICDWVVFTNHSVGNLYLGTTLAGVSGAVRKTIAPGTSYTLDKFQGRKLWVYNPQGVGADWSMEVRYSRHEFPADAPGEESGEHGFPVFDDTTTTAIQPGVAAT